MVRLHDIRIKSNTFVANMNVNIALSIQSVEKELVDENRKQMLQSKDSEFNPLMHGGTGSELLSPAYAKRTRKRTPNLYLSGDFQKAMFLDVNENNLTWFINSEDDKANQLVINYRNIFGIYNKDYAKTITGLAFRRRYRRLVLGK